MPQLLAPFASIALILLFLPACSTHISGPLTVGTVEQLKAEALNNSVVVDYAAVASKASPGAPPRPMAHGGPIRSAHSVLTGVSLDWMTFGTATEGYQRIASSRVQRIELTDTGRGAIHGLFYGLLSGVAAGALVGAIAASGDCTQSGSGYYTTTKCPSQAGSMTKLGFVGGLGGGLVGVLAGTISGYRTTFEF